MFGSHFPSRERIDPNLNEGRILKLTGGINDRSTSGLQFETGAGSVNPGDYAIRIARQRIRHIFFRCEKMIRDFLLSSWR